MIISTNQRKLPMLPCLSRLVGLLCKLEDGVMKRILLTGMSGTGKTTVIGELAARGYKAVDADGDEFSQWEQVTGEADAEITAVDGNRDWMWREDRMQELLSTEDTDVLFVSGCAENMPTFFPQFNLIVLLSAPASVIVERLRTRTSNQYGKRPDEVARVLSLVESVEPRLRRAAGYEIDTSAPLEEVVGTLLQRVQSQP
jgi:shikimate kinase